MQADGVPPALRRVRGRPSSGCEKTGKKAGVQKCRKPNGRQCKYGKNMISCRRREADTRFGGRLSAYRYYDMDQVIAAALTLTAQERG